MIHGISAVFLPFKQDRPDLDALGSHIERTVRAGLVPAVNMDTGFGALLTPAQRRDVLKIAQPPFVAGAFGEADVHDIAAAGGTPIVFPVAELERILAGCDEALAFELSPAFSPLGRLFDADTVKRLMAMPNVVGMKHSSLRRTLEMERLALRNAERPGFRIYTGNDLAIDMIEHGSDYLLGLSTFEPEAFALRDRWFTGGDERWRPLNDALQQLGWFAFRPPVPAYKWSAAVYLGARPHPDTPPRPAWEPELMEQLAQAVRSSMSAPAASSSNRS